MSMYGVYEPECAPAGGDYGMPRVVIPAPQDERHAHLAWPKIVKGPDGNLVAAFLAAREHTVGGCPATALSRDDGSSFTAPRVLKQFDATEDYHHSGNVALGVAGDGAIVLLAMAMVGDERNTIFGWRSTDSGVTWEPTDTGTLGNNATGSVYGSVFRVPGRGLAVCGHYRQPRGRGIWIAFSRDDGRSWGPPRTISDERRYGEPAFVCTKGRLIGLVRESPQPHYHQFVSEDSGRTWLRPRVVMEGPNATHPSPFLAVDPREPQRLYALQSQRTERGEVFLWEADAGELNWRRRGLVVTFKGCEDYSYPWMVHLSGDEWLMVFYAGSRRGENHIWGMRLRTAD